MGRRLLSPNPSRMLSFTLKSMVRRVVLASYRFPMWYIRLAGAFR